MSLASIKTQDISGK